MITLILSKIIPIKLMAWCLMNNREWIPNNRIEIRTCQGSIRLAPHPLLICNSISPPLRDVPTINPFKPRVSHRSSDRPAVPYCPHRRIPSWKSNLKWGISNDWHRMHSTFFRKMTNLSCLKINSRFSISKKCFLLNEHPSTTRAKVKREMTTSHLRLVFIRQSKMLGSSIWCLKHRCLTKIQLVDLEICHPCRIKSE